jgi:hypothetical protein
MKPKFVMATVLLFGATALLVGGLRAQNAPDTRERMIALGRQHKTAEALYEALKAEARGGRRLKWTNLPDWSGVYTRARGGITYDPDQPQGGLPTAKLTPEYEARLKRRIELANQVPARLRHLARPDVADERDGQRRPPHLHRRARPRPGRRSLSPV